MNRLSNEKSPYLLQHADNPVDWFPWGEEAFARAKREDKPVFLSVGYSTCHWCHVMAHESFEDEEVAAALNRDYVCVKVDREERPDVDAVYMAVCQALTGSGGWPLTIVMTPDQQPFWAGTYLPKRAAYGRIGLIGLLSAIQQKWDAEREKLVSAGNQITAMINGRDAADKTAEPDRALLHRAFRSLERAYDPRWGGFGAAPKFPTPHNLLFLLQYSLLEGAPSARRMAEHTLAQMFRGGLFDHLGGGFSRYSTDEKWLAPHFEKMLYDNALLAHAYLEAYHVARRPLYRAVAERALDYVLRELTDPKGGFYCGQDADSDGVEGKYYLFTRREIDSVLGEDGGAALGDWFGVSERGNFEGKNILNLLDNPRYEETDAGIGALADRLFAYRAARTRLHTDDKVLASWNALMIAALARAGRLLDNPAYLRAARKAQRFLEENMVGDGGRLMLRWRGGEAAHQGHLDDYAFYAFALLALYDADYEADDLRRAADVARRMIDQFWDADAGGFYLYGGDGEQLISRPKETYDGAIPSGNAVAGWVLERLARLTGEEAWRQLADRQIRFLAGAAQDYPAGHCMALTAIAKVVYPAQELVCAAAGGEMPAELASFLAQNALPNLALILKTHGNQVGLAQIAPFTESYPIPERGAAYYLCSGGACDAPVFDVPSLAARLRPQ
ncbi:MAG: thioredoxin domain-containing protein [Clostridiales bacterium]|nr:thioredoxin domain-containing protein [Clostridiales bacterium]